MRKPGPPLGDLRERSAPRDGILEPVWPLEECARRMLRDGGASNGALPRRVQYTLNAMRSVAHLPHLLKLTLTLTL